MNNVLTSILDHTRQVRAAGRPPVLVFDLDATLIDTRPRHLAILRGFAAEHGDRWPAVVPVAAASTPASFAWDVTEPLDVAGVTDAALRDALRAYWFGAFFHDAWLAHDTAGAGAVAYVRAAHDAGAIVVYLTARTRDAMARGTVDSLLTLGFPLLDGRALLQLKGDASQTDAAFKASALDAIDALGGQVVATFENEPGHANRFLARWPAATHVLLDTTHSPGAPALASGVHVVPDFRRA